MTFRPQGKRKKRSRWGRGRKFISRREGGRKVNAQGKRLLGRDDISPFDGEKGPSRAAHSKEGGRKMGPLGKKETSSYE